LSLNFNKKRLKIAILEISKCFPSCHKSIFIIKSSKLSDFHLISNWIRRKFSFGLAAGYQLFNCVVTFSSYSLILARLMKGHWSIYIMLYRFKRLQCRSFNGNSFLEIIQLEKQATQQTVAIVQY